MNISISKLKQCLGDLRPEVSPACYEAEFSQVRLYDPDLPAGPDTLCLGTEAQFLGNGKPDVIGRLGEVQLRFPGQDVSGILERIRQVLARYDSWLAECTCLSDLAEELSLLGWQKNDRKRILILCSRQQNMLQVDPDSLQELAGQDGNVYPVSYQGHLVLLLNDELQQSEQQLLDLQLKQAEGKEARELKDQASMQHWQNLYGFLNRLDQFLKVHQCAAYYSYPFRETGLLDQYYQQTVSLLSLVPLVPGTRHGCLDALSYLGYQGCPVSYEALLHPFLPFLKQYDHAHGTDFYLTLCDILNSGGNKSKAAEVPGIDGNHMHRNTVKRRLEKIKELVPVELDDPQQTKALLFSYYFDLRFSTYLEDSPESDSGLQSSEGMKKSVR